MRFLDVILAVAFALAVAGAIGLLIYICWYSPTPYKTAFFALVGGNIGYFLSERYLP